MVGTPILGTNLSSLIVPFTTADNYPTHDEQYGKGGYRTVANDAARDAIPAQRRAAGMLVYVDDPSDNGTMYQLQDDLETWIAFDFGGATGANPTATAGPTAIDGSADTFMRSDAAPAIQLGSNAQPGILQADGTTIEATGGTISSVGGPFLVTGAPTFSAPAGALASRKDLAAVYSSQPTGSGSAAVVQHTSVVGAFATPGTISLGSTPTIGNLIIVFVAWGEASSPGPTINTTDWTEFNSFAGSVGGSIGGFALYRYVQSGDTSTLPALCTSGTEYWAAAAYEISGVSGTFTTDVTLYEGQRANASSITSTNQTTSSNGSVAILFGAQYDGSSNPTYSGSWTVDEAQNNAFNFGSVASASQSSLTSGTTVSGTVSFGRSDGGTTIQQIVVNGGSLGANWELIGGESGGTFVQGPPGYDGNDGDDAIMIPGLQGPPGPSIMGPPGHDGNDGDDAIINPGPAPGVPTATAGPAAIPGSAPTFMRSDAAPAVQIASTSQRGLMKADGTTIQINGGGTISVNPSLVVAGPPGHDGNDGDDAIPIPGQPGGPGIQGAPGIVILPEDGVDGSDAIPIPGLQGIGIQGAPGIVVLPEDGVDGSDAIPIPGPQGPTGTSIVGPPGQDGRDSDDEGWWPLDPTSSILNVVAATYLTISNAALDYLPLTGGTLTGVLNTDSEIHINAGAPASSLLIVSYGNGSNALANSQIVASGVTMTGVSGGSSGFYIANQFASEIGGTTSTDGTMLGLFGVGEYNGTGTAASVTGGAFNAYCSGAGAVINLIGASCQVLTQNASAAVTAGRGLEILSPNLTSGSTVGNLFGLDVGTQKTTGVTTGFGIRTQGASDLNLFNGTVSIGKLTAATTQCDIDGNSAVAGVQTESYQRIAPSTGFSQTISNNVCALVIFVTAGGTLATGTVTMPATPLDGQEVALTTNGTITTLTISPNTSQTISGAPTTLSKNTPVTFMYVAADTNWYCISV